jgi:hypothetical protein
LEVFPAIKKKADWLYNGSSLILAERLIAFAAEGIFSGAFVPFIG